MALSAAAPSLNRFPGLTLRAWVLFYNGTVLKQFNVASVSQTLGAATVNFTSALTGGGYVADISACAPSAYMVSASAGSANLEFTYDTGTQVNVNAPVFVAFYG